MNNANDSPGLYIHIPFCQKKCAYCAFYSEPVDKYNTEKFVEALKKEILRIDDKSVNTVYVGGGSPSALPVELLGELLALVSSEFPNIEEFTVEINPAQTTLKLLETLADNKVTRLSTGVQSFSRRQLNRLGRIHSPAGAQKAVKNAQAMGFDNINIDLIFAIPGSNIVSVNNNIQKAIELDVQHISAYSLSLEPLTAITRDVNAGKLKAVSNQLDARMYESIIRKLTNCGFLHYEISNFAKQNHQCLHNLKYWSNETFYAAGPGAHSFVNNIRAENVSDIKQYISLIDAGKKPVSRSHALSWEEYACQTAVLNLRKTKGLNLSQYQKKVGKDVRELFAGAVEKLTNQGLLQLSQDYLCLAETALPAADTVMREFAIIEKDY